MVIESPDDQKLEAGTGTQQLQNFYQLQPQFLNRKVEHCGMETFGENEINTGQINAQQQLDSEPVNFTIADRQKSESTRQFETAQSNQGLIRHKILATDESLSKGKQEEEGGPWMIQTRSKAAKRKPPSVPSHPEQTQADFQLPLLSDLSKPIITELPSSNGIKLYTRVSIKLKTKAKSQRLVWTVLKLKTQVMAQRLAHTLYRQQMTSVNLAKRGKVAMRRTPIGDHNHLDQSLLESMRTRGSEQCIFYVLFDLFLL